MKKIITYGSFDLFHEGHYKLLERAKALGDYLIVGITTEQYDNQRGKFNVVDSLMERIENVKNSGFADEIIIEDHIGQKVEDIIKYDIDTFVVGSDWIGVFDYINEYCEVVYLERTKGISSTMLRSRNHPIIRLGIVGTGRIANRFVPEVRYISGIAAEAVYNPNIDLAKEFFEKFNLNYYSNKYDDFLSQVDAVYIASPHQTHYEYVKQALLAHKNVLCEKPIVLTKEQAEDVYKIAEENHLVLLEGIKTAYCPGFKSLLSVINSNLIGHITDVEACFTKLEDPSKRELIDVQYGGSFTELSSYTLLPIIKILGTNYKKINFKSIKNERGIDLYTKAYFEYNNAFATAKVGLGVKSEGQLIISGTKGYIIVEAPWWKTQSFEVRFENQENNEKYFSKYLGEGLRYEISYFVSKINGINNEEKYTPQESIAIAEIIDNFRKDRI